MMTDEDKSFYNLLCAPFEADEVKVRSVQGRSLHYITARTAMNRLDDAVGPGDWWDDYEKFGDSVKCTLSIRMPDGEVVSKCGVGGVTEMHDPSDTDKTGESDALKRACVKFGIARYLYRDGVPHYLGDQPPPTTEPPRTPPAGRPAAPASQRQPQAAAPPRREAAPRGNSQYDDWKPPAGKKGFYPWLCHVEQTYGGAKKLSNDIAKDCGFPFKSTEWDDAQAEEVAWLLIDEIKAWPAYAGEFDHLQDPRLGD